MTIVGELLHKNGTGQHSDRRTHGRLNLRWHVLLYRKAVVSPVPARIENISGGGFFCVAAEPFTPCERLTACILLPRVDRSGAPGTCLVECEVEVVHVGPDGQNGFGMGCRIDHYAFRRDSSPERHAMASNGS